MKRTFNILLSEYVNVFRSKVLDSKKQRDLRVVTAAVSISFTFEAQTARKMSLRAGFANILEASRLREGLPPVSERREAALPSRVFPDYSFFFSFWTTVCAGVWRSLHGNQRSVGTQRGSGFHRRG